MKYKISKILGIIIIIPVLYIFIVLAYNFATIIDENITEGSGYGFTIGQSKGEVFLKAQELYNDRDIEFTNYYYEHFHQGKSLIRKPFLEIDLNFLIPHDHWEFDFHERATDYLSLNFKDGKLSEIVRMRYPEL